MPQSELCDGEGRPRGGAPVKGCAYLHVWLLSGCMLCGFGVWLSWSVIAVLLLQLGYPYSISALFSLVAIAGIAGASLRMTLGFFVPHNAGPLLLTLSVVLLLVPALGTGLALHIGSPFWVLQLLALLSGLGGGFFSVFFTAASALVPHYQRSTALSFGIGLGHFGVVASQIFLPLIVTLNLGYFSGTTLASGKNASTLLGAVTQQQLWIQNVGFLWSLLLIVLLLLVGVTAGGERYRRARRRNLSARRKSTARRVSVRVWTSVGWALLVGLFISALGLWLTLPAAANGLDLQLSRELVVAAVVSVTLVLMRLLPVDAHIQPDCGAPSPYSIFNNKHAWVMSILGAMSLGSFLGLAGALPLTMELIFGYVPSADGVRLPNPNAPGIFTYVWMGPLVGVLMRPVGGWAAGHFGGARVTQWCALVMTMAAAAAALYVAEAYRAPEPEQYFFPLLLLTLVLFAAAGASHASVLATVERLFPLAQSRYLNSWIAGIAAFGMFYIPQLLSDQLERGTPEQAVIGFAVFYGLCLLLNGWFYLRRDGAFYNP